MLNHQTMEKLTALRLEGMAQGLEEQRRQADITQLDFEERFGLLVERQWLWRENRALAARLHHAQLKVAASVEDIDYRHPRGLKRAQIDQLRASQWVANHHNCLITGPTGSGKTYLACALAHQACRDGQRVGYYYAPKLFRELQNAQTDGSLLKLLKKLARAALIVIDDFGVAAVTGKQYRDLLEILDDRHGLASTLITSQFPVDEWHGVINDATVADAILDRLVHNAYRLKLEGESMRDPKTKSKANRNPSD
ncbi:MAG TPA: IS21-like element helper ATPase IstB [Verrucomicrobiae bacterium]|nr:IS21-like element helper ATPase IstB [Verrucomicrobiae bacterium]